MKRNISTIAKKITVAPDPCTTTPQDTWEFAIDAKATEWENDARGCYGSFVGVLNEIAEDCDDAVLEALHVAYTAQNYELIGRAFADCVYNSCHRTAEDYSPRPR